jgi:hypothetical protein
LIVGDSTMLLGLASALIPADADADSEIVPEKPLRALTVMVEVPEDPASIDRDVAVLMLKSTTVTVMMAEWVSVPLVPVTVTE